MLPGSSAASYAGMASSSLRRTAQLLAGAAAAAALYRLLPGIGSFRRGNVVLICGGSRGLGLALAERFGRAGARLVLAARDGAELGRARDLLVKRGDVAGATDVLVVPTDLTKAEAVQALVRKAERHFGRIDVLINNAAIIEVGPFQNQPISAFEKAMEINFFGTLYAIQAALPEMLRRFRESRERSSIVNISSIGGKFGVPHLLPYVASKYAVTGLSEGLNAELRFQGVRVTTVCPGLMRTGSSGQAKFTGRKQQEQEWFSFSATTPGIATTAEHAANRIFNATVRGFSEITITPQAWLGARANGLLPGLTSFVSALANEYLLPEPAEGGEQELHLGREVHQDTRDRAAAQAAEHNQPSSAPAAP